MSTLCSARDFAIRAHGDQRYGEHPYVYHLEAVAALVEPFGEQTQIVAWLHDVVEDTSVSLEELANLFGSEVSAAVAFLTDEPGVNRRERKERTHAKLSRCQHNVALIVKAADRLANLQMSIATGNEPKLAMYRREQASFKAAVYRPGLCDELWRQIDAIVGPQ